MLTPEQKLIHNDRRLRELIPSGAHVLTSLGWWTLAQDRSVYDPNVSDIKDLDRIEYFVTDSNGTSQPGVWFRPGNLGSDKMVRDNFKVVSDSLPRTPLRIFGIRVTNSAYGFGTLILRRFRPEPR